MTFFLIILAVIIFIIIAYIIGSNVNTQEISTQKTKHKRTEKTTVKEKTQTTTEQEKIPTVAELMKTVETIEDFVAFEKKQEEISNKYSEDYDNRYYEKLYNRYEDAYSKISDKISEKIFFYQYLPEIDLETSLKDLAIAYEVFTVEKYKLVKKNTTPENWEEINGNCLMGGQKLEESLVKKPDYFDLLTQFRQVVESKLTLEEKYISLVYLVKNNPIFKTKFFPDNNISIENQVMIWITEPYKIPQLDKLIELGFNTPDKLKKITKEQLQEIKGFGATRIEQFEKIITTF